MKRDLKMIVGTLLGMGGLGMLHFMTWLHLMPIYGTENAFYIATASMICAGVGVGIFAHQMGMDDLRFQIIDCRLHVGKLPMPQVKAYVEPLEPTWRVMLREARETQNRAQTLAYYQNHKHLKLIVDNDHRKI